MQIAIRGWAATCEPQSSASGRGGSTIVVVTSSALATPPSASRARSPIVRRPPGLGASRTSPQKPLA